MTDGIPALACVDCGEQRPPRKRRCVPCAAKAKAAWWRNHRQSARDETASRRTEKSCDSCGETFASSDRRKKYCTADCGRRNHDRRRATRTLYVNACTWCEREFSTRVKGQRTCSTVCGGKNGAGLPSVRICPCCTVEFSAVSREFCSEGCRTWSRKHPGIRLDRPCGNCCQPFARTQRRQRFCSRLCLRSAVEKRRRARLQGAPRDLVSPLDIFERDGWTCHICDEHIDATLRRGDPMMPSIDHVIPVTGPSYPGHIASNLAAAHLICNNRKRQRSLDEIRVILAQERQTT